LFHGDVCLVAAVLGDARRQVAQSRVTVRSARGRQCGISCNLFQKFAHEHIK